MTVKLNKKFYIAGKQNYETAWLLKSGCSQVHSIEECDFVLFNGGTDVNPKLYNQPRGKYTEKPDLERDKLEVEEFKKAQELGKFCVGICRGSQLLCVLSGGSLIQHVNNHNKSHNYYDIKGKSFTIGSWHHQMMFPFTLPENQFKIIGVSEITDCVHLNGNNNNITYTKNFQEVETCIFFKTKSISIQSHPDWIPEQELFLSYLDEFFKKNTISTKTLSSLERFTIKSNFKIESNRRSRRIPAMTEIQNIDIEDIPGMESVSMTSDYVWTPSNAWYNSVSPTPTETNNNVVSVPLSEE